MGLKKRKMSYTSRKASDALKEIGFDDRCRAYYFDAHPNTIQWYKDYSRSNSELSEYAVTAPNHLEAADWLMQKSGGEVAIIFEFIRTTISHCENLDESKPTKLKHFTSQPDHRDLAIIEACKIIKERKTNPLP